MLAQTVVYPFDVVRRRMQTHSGAEPLYRGPIHALRTIAREEGIRGGLFRGLSLNYLKTMPNVKTAQLAPIFMRSSCHFVFCF